MNNQTLRNLVALRRDLHRHPEPRFAETRTARILADRLRAMRFSVVEEVGGTGVVAVLDSGRPGRHVLLRADMDALTTTDLKTVDYASSRPGVAHACGHDVHCAVAIGAAGLLACGDALDDGGRVTVILQPAEEIPFGELSGARTMLDSGVLDVEGDAVLALHCWPHLPVGTVGVDVETAMAAKLAFKISVHGQGAHAATPQLGRDALLGASQIVVALHSMVNREVASSERIALNVGTVTAGTSQSIVPALAELSGTVRSIDPDVGQRVRDSVERVAAGVAATYGLTAEVEWKNEMPRVRNDARLVDLAFDVLPRIAEVEDVATLQDPPMTSDDFALFAERWPGMYLKLGVAAAGADGWPSLHDGHFDVDERCIAVGAHTLAALARQVLRHGLEPRAVVDGAPDNSAVAEASL